MLKQIKLTLSIVSIATSLAISGFPLGIPQAAADNRTLETTQTSSDLARWAESGNYTLVDRASKPELPHGNPKLDRSLGQLIREKTVEEAESFASQGGLKLKDGNVKVSVYFISEQGETAAKAVTDAGGELTSTYKSGIIFDAWIPITKLESVANEKSISYIEQIDPGVLLSTSEGREVINADKWGVSYNGTGIKVGIIDQGFDGWQTLQDTELPQIPSEQRYEVTTTGISHGTSVAEIIYDIAPGSQLYLAQFGGPAEFLDAADWLIDTIGVDIISSSVGFPGRGPGDGTYLYAQKVKDASDNGILWVQAAGNFAESHWSGTWTDDDEDGYLDFSSGDWTNGFYLDTSRDIDIYLNWNDSWGSASHSFNVDLYKNGNWVKSGNSENTTNPFSQLHYAADNGSYEIAIYDDIYGDPPSSNTKFNLYLSAGLNASLEYPVAAGSLGVPADSSYGITVGAVSWSSPTTIKDYSSRGPTTDNETKPDLVAPTDVTTYTDSNFEGTSAAQPHVAGAAAIVKQYLLSEDLPASPEDIQDFLETNAVHLGDTGKNNTFGSGRVSLPLPTVVINVNTTFNIYPRVVITVNTN